MKHFIPKSLKVKLTIALFGIGFLPYLLIMLYSLYFGKQQILQRIGVIQEIQMNEIKTDVEKAFDSLHKEMHFLSSLDIMNDMIVGDLDKRISELLIQKYDDLNLEMDLLAVTNDAKIIASSSHHKMAEYFSDFRLLKKAVSDNHAFFTTKDSITLFTPIKPHLNYKGTLGYLILNYKLTNLNTFTVKHDGVRSMFYNPLTSQQIGLSYTSPLVFTHTRGNDIKDDTMISYEKFDGALQNWYLVYMVKKSLALSFLNDFLLFLSAMLIVGFIVIAILSFKISKHILDPIAALSDAAKQIIKTKNYATRVSINSDNEINDLARDFNVMVHQTQKAFQELESENRLRLKRFVQLINIFNHLIQTQHEQECIDVALQELRSFIPEQHFLFSKQQQKDIHNSIPLYLKDFEKDTQEYYGSILLNLQSLDDPHEEKFYRSVVTMIMLQLNQIRLINRTKDIAQAKSSFISHMSHELRTPLHAILSFSQYLITYENLNEVQQDNISNIENSAQHLLSMINDILDLVRIDAGKISAVCTQADSDDIKHTISDVIAMLEVLAEQKAITITLKSNVDKQLKARVDLHLLKQIMINLISNAIKFTDEGKIEVSIHSQENHLAVSVVDTGRGISQKDLSLLFDDFTQADNQRENTQKGSGLGLSISQKLAHLFNAKIELYSKGIHHGTTATLYLDF